MGLSLPRTSNIYVSVPNSSSIEDFFQKTGGSSVFMICKPQTGIPTATRLLRKSWESRWIFNDRWRFIHPFSTSNKDTEENTGSFTENAWHTVGLYYDASSTANGVELHLDGTKKTEGSGLTTSTPSGTAVSDSASSLDVSRSAGPGAGFDVQVVALWAGVKLTDQEFEALDNGADPCTIRPDKLVLYHNYKTLDAPDLSGNQNNGTLENSPTLIDNYYNTPEEYQEFGTPTLFEDSGAATGTKTFTMDAVIKKEDLTKTFTVDSVIQQQDLTKTFTIDSVIQNIITKTFTIDAVIQALNRTKTFTIDAIIQLVNQTKTFTIDTIIQIANQTKTFTIDAVITSATTTKTFTIDTVIKTLNLTKTFTIDTVIQLLNQTKTFTIDAIIQKLQTKTFTIDSVIKGSKTKTFTIDTITKALGKLKTFTIDAVINPTPGVSNLGILKVKSLRTISKVKSLRKTLKTQDN